MSASIFNMRPFDYCAAEKEKKKEARKEIQERRLLLSIELNFSPFVTSSVNQGVLDENALMNTTRKKSL